ncbi:MAG: nucleotide sugar dehydrogenase [Bacillota bacterium]
MSFLKKIKQGEEPISVVGLGYVGLPLAVAFGAKVPVIGFDINMKKIEEYSVNIDRSGEVSEEQMRAANVMYTCNPEDLRKAKFHIVAVPTPVDKNHKPDLKPVLSASTIIGRNLTQDSIVVYESTVYPGVTEDICVPVLEKESGLKCGIDFFVGYSPERINPGDKEHTIDKIVKIVSGQDEKTLEIIAGVYEIIVTAGVHRASSIKVAEAAKVIENTQRDLNIALMNELAIIFDKMGIDTIEVLKAASTKWNFLKFYPGLVGGHCIGVDPYYLTFKAEEIGYRPEVILAGRRINDSMGKFVAEKTVKNIIKSGKNVKGSKVLILGCTFKENVPDIRNSKVFDIVNELREYEVDIIVSDPIASSSESLAEYDVSLTDFNEVCNVDAVILAVAHKKYLEMDQSEITSKLSKGKSVLIDVKGIMDRHRLSDDIIYWRL